MIETNKFARKPFYVDAVQVTAENIEQVAAWCSGDVRTEENNSKYIKVRVARPMNERQTKAYIGDWVLYAGTGYKVYTNKAFVANFDQQGQETKIHSTPQEELHVADPTPTDLVDQLPQTVTFSDGGTQTA